MTDYPGRLRYRGDVAARYLELRSSDRKWQLEQELMSRLIAALPAGSSILDVPLGTGRYLPFYEQSQHRVVGVDISGDMLRQAQNPALIARVLGDITTLPLRDGAVDYAVSTRLMNWLPRAVFGRALAELARVSRKGILLGIREVERLAIGQLPNVWSELVSAPVASLRRLARPAFRRKIPSIILHPATAVRAEIARNGLEIEDVFVVEEGTAFSRRPFHYAPLRTYVLRRAS